MADYGAFKTIVDTAGAVASAGVALRGLVFGKVLFDPPVPKRQTIVRFLSVLCGVVLSLLWWFGHSVFDTSTFAWIATGAAIASVLALVLYLTAYFALRFTCDDDPGREYLAGLRQRPQVRAVLAGDLNQPKPYGPLKQTPTDVYVYFASSGRRPAFLWQTWSIYAAQILMVLLFAILMLGATTMLSAGAMLLLEPQTEVETESGETRIEIPADDLFEFDKADIRPAANKELKRTAAILRDRGIKSARIEGYADNRGDAAYNLALSERRAAAVYEWLQVNGDIKGIDLHVVGRGVANPRAPNEKSDGNDSPEGQALNRRVEIVFIASR